MKRCISVFIFFLFTTQLFSMYSSASRVPLLARTLYGYSSPPLSSSSSTPYIGDRYLGFSERAGLRLSRRPHGTLADDGLYSDSLRDDRSLYRADLVEDAHLYRYGIQPTLMQRIRTNLEQAALQEAERSKQSRFRSAFLFSPQRDDQFSEVRSLRLQDFPKVLDDIVSVERYQPDSYDQLDKVQKKQVKEEEYKDYIKRYREINDVDIDAFTYRVDGHEVNGFALFPKTQSPEKKPVVIYNRGGHRSWGKNDLMSIMDNMLFLAKNGYIVLASQYRGTTDPEIVDEFGGVDVADSLKLLDIASELDNADLSNVFIVGFSRGTIMSYRMLQELDKKIPIRAYVGIGGVSDMDAYLKENPRFIKPLLLDAVKNFDENYQEECKKRSVCEWIDVLDGVPSLLIHHNEDPVVPVSQSVKLHENLQKAGVKNKLKIYQGKAHMVPKEDLESVNNATLEWLESHKI